MKNRKKKIAGILISGAILISSVIPAFAANINYYTSIQNGGKTAVGVTSCPGAYSVTANTVGFYEGGQVSKYAGGTSSTQAIATTSYTGGFYHASTQHTVDIYEGGLSQHYSRSSSASR